MKYALKPQLIGVALAFCMLTSVTVPTTASPSPSPSNQPTPTPSIKPSVFPSARPSHYCASSVSGKPVRISGVHCGRGNFYLGYGPLNKGKSRPAQLDPLLKNRIRAVQLSATAKGFSVGVTSGWRSLNDQQRIYNNAVKLYKNQADRWALPPEKSMHPWGLAVDLHFGSQAAANWFKQNSWTFGLCRVYKNEWWHFEPVIAPGGKCPRLKVNAS